MKRAVVIGVAVLAAAGIAAVLVSFSGAKSKSKLHGQVTFGVLAAAQRTGPLGRRGQDLVDGANMAAADINGRGGLLGRRLVLSVADDGCSVPIAYEAAKSIGEGSGITGVVGGMCDDSTAREVAVIDSSGIPFLVTSANGKGVVTPDVKSAYLMNGTIYQQALSAVFWMNYRSAQRLAILGDPSSESQALTHNVIRLVDQTPQLVSLQTVRSPSDVPTMAKAAVAAHPNFIFWTGSPATGGALAKALHGLGYKGTFTASAASESPKFLAAAGPDGAEGAFVTATSNAENTPNAAKWLARFKATYHHAPGLDALQAYDAVRTLAQATRQAGSTNTAQISANLLKLNDDFTTFLGVVRFAGDHTLLYDNRVILVVKNGRFAWKRSLRTDSLQ